MSVTLRLPTVLAKAAGGLTVHQAKGATVGAVVEDLAGRFPELAPRLRDAKGEPYPYVIFYLDDEDNPVPEGVRDPRPGRRGESSVVPRSREGSQSIGVPRRSSRRSASRRCSATAGISSSPRSGSRAEAAQGGARAPGGRRRPRLTHRALPRRRGRRDPGPGGVRRGRRDQPPAPDPPRDQGRRPQRSSTRPATGSTT